MVSGKSTGERRSFRAGNDAQAGDSRAGNGSQSVPKKRTLDERTNLGRTLDERMSSRRRIAPEEDENDDDNDDSLERNDHGAGDFREIGQRVDSRSLNISRESSSMVSASSSLTSTGSSAMIGVRISSRESTPQMGIGQVTQLCLHRVFLEDVSTSMENIKAVESLAYGCKLIDGRLEASIRKGTFVFQYYLVDDGDKVVSFLQHFLLLFKVQSWLHFLGIDCDLKETALRIALGRDLEIQLPVPKGLNFLSPKLEVLFYIYN